MTPWPGVGVGSVVAPLTRTIGLPDMVAYAGATWDWHRMHYDTGYLAAARLSRPIVDGQMLGALLAETVQDWLGPTAFLRRLEFRFASPVYAGEAVRCQGEVTEATAGTITVALQAVVPGDPDRLAVGPARAVVGRWP
jgi:acyl dehydratase